MWLWSLSLLQSWSWWWLVIIAGLWVKQSGYLLVLLQNYRVIMVLMAALLLLPSSEGKEQMKGLVPECMAKPKTVVVLWFILPFFSALMFSGAGEFIQTPRPTRVQLEETGNFWCLARANTVYWVINDSDIIPPDIQWTSDYTEDGFNMTLVVPAVEKYNNSLIKCCLYVYYTQDNQIQNCSEAASLVIEGKIKYKLTLMY